MLSEFVVNPGSGGQYTVDLQKDFVYGLGQLLVERRVSGPRPMINTNSTFESGGQYGFEFDGPIEFGSYLVDIRTDSGYINQISGVIPDANGVFWIDEADFAIDETNEVRVRGESGQAEPYSEPVTVTIDSSVIATSENQVRTMGVTRDGTDLTIRWQQLTPNGKSTYLYFDRADGGGTIPLTPFGIAPGITEYTIASHALSSPKGSIYATQMDAQLNETSGTGAACVPTMVGGGSHLGSSCDPDPDPPEPDPNDLQFATSWHHRDHLGSLRVLSDVASDKLDTHDFYPFGTEFVTSTGEALGPSFKMYTGHERDEQTGLDYMMARYCGSQLGSFLGVDPGPFRVETPQNLNRYRYVRNNPLSLVDPTGREEESSETPWYKKLTERMSFRQFVDWASSKIFAPRDGELPQHGVYLVDPESDLGKLLTGDVAIQRAEKALEGINAAVSIVRAASNWHATHKTSIGDIEDGDVDTANQHFDSIPGTNERTTDNGNTRIKDLPDGRTVIVRQKSKDGRPALEFQDKREDGKIEYVKFRYGPKLSDKVNGARRPSPDQRDTPDD